MGLLVLVWRPLLMGRVWEFPLSLLTITDDDDVIGPISCPIFLRSSMFWSVTGIRKGSLTIIYIYIYLLNYLFMLHK